MPKINKITKNGVSYDIEDSNAATAASLTAETTARQTADNGLQSQIDAITSASDVVDVVGTYAELMAYDTQHLKPNDIIKVLTDETHQNAISYYRWTQTQTPGSFVYIGSQGPFYTKVEADALLDEKQDTLTPGENITIEGKTISATDTTYDDFVGATSSAAGEAGLVPVPTTADVDKFLKGDGTWGESVGVTEIALTGTSGTLTATQIATVLDASKYVVFVNGGKVYTLSDKDSTLTYRTYINTDAATTSTLEASAIYVQLNEEAVNYGHWTMEDITVGGTPSAIDLDELIDGTDDITVDLNYDNDTLLIGTHAKTVEITGVPATATQGTLTEEQLAALLESEKSVIKFNNEIYFLNDNGHEAGIRGYSHSGVENSKFMLKNITVTISTGGWVLTSEEVGGGVNVVQTTGTSTTDVMSQNAVTNLVYDGNNNRRIAIGSRQTALPSSGSGVVIGGSTRVQSALLANIVLIGDSTEASNSMLSVLVGSSANASNAQGSVIVGYDSETHGENEVSIGYSAGANNAGSRPGSINLGAYSQSSAQGEMNIGTTRTSYGYNNSNYRLLSGVYDPQGDHDAATKGYVDGLVGNVSSALNAINNGSSN